MYWGKGDEHLKKYEPFLPFPSDVVLDDKIYVSNQYKYTKERIDHFRNVFKDMKGLPPGLALIGSPGIGELVNTHLFT